MCALRAHDLQRCVTACDYVLERRKVSQSVSYYHTPSRELMAHTLTLLTRVRVYGGDLWTKVNIEWVFWVSFR